MRRAGEPSVDEILDSIKQVIARDVRVGSIGPLPAVHDDGDVLDLAVAASVIADPEPATAPLVTAGSRAAMRESLAALAVVTEAPTGPQGQRAGETSLEGLTRELLRPALAAWLDQHLPAIVEQLVAREIARIVGTDS